MCGHFQARSLESEPTWTRRMRANTGSGFVFPVRMGRDTIELTPDQLSMFMLPEARRAAILIGAIDPGTQITVTSHSPEVGQWPMRLLSADAFSNSLSLEHGEGS